MPVAAEEEGGLELSTSAEREARKRGFACDDEGREIKKQRMEKAAMGEERDARREGEKAERGGGGGAERGEKARGVAQGGDGEEKTQSGR